MPGLSAATVAAVYVDLEYFAEFEDRTLLNARGLATQNLRRIILRRLVIRARNWMNKVPVTSSSCFVNLPRISFTPFSNSIISVIRVSPFAVLRKHEQLRMWSELKSIGQFNSL